VTCGTPERFSGGDHDQPAAHRGGRTICWLPAAPVGARARRGAEASGAFRFGSHGRAGPHRGPIPSTPNAPPAPLRTAQAAGTCYLEQGGGDDDRVGRGSRVALMAASTVRGTSLSLAAGCGDGRRLVRKASVSRSSATVGGVWSYVHIDDAAAARPAAAVDQGPARAIYNVVDDDPRARVGVAAGGWASALDAKPPRRVPRWLGRLLAGEAATAMMTDAEGSLEREGQARTRLAAAVFRAGRQGFAPGTRLSDAVPTEAALA